MRVQGHNPETETQPYAPTSPPKVVLTSPFQVRETKAGICNKPFSRAAGITARKKKQPQYALQFNRGYMLEVAY